MNHTQFLMLWSYIVEDKPLKNKAKTNSQIAIIGGRVKRIIIGPLGVLGVLKSDT